MPTPKTILFALLTVVALTFAAAWAGELRRRRQWAWPRPWELLVGFVTDFFDALGIGSFATTTTLYRLSKSVPDEQIPGTLNVGHCLPTFVQAIVFSEVVAVESTTLVTLIAASVLGSWLGAGFVTRMPRRQIQWGMGTALAVAAALMIARNSGFFPAEGELPAEGAAAAISGGKLVAGAIACFVFGALMTIGIGAYAPIMILVSLLGMNPKTAWPIMTGACAFLMPTCGIRFIRAGAYSPRAALGLTLAGIPAVFVAAPLLNRLPISSVRWLVAAIVAYTAWGMIRAAMRETASQQQQP